MCSSRAARTFSRIQPGSDVAGMVVPVEFRTGAGGPASWYRFPFRLSSRVELSDTSGLVVT